MAAACLFPFCTANLTPNCDDLRSDTNIVGFLKSGRHAGQLCERAIGGRFHLTTHIADFCPKASQARHRQRVHGAFCWHLRGPAPPSWSVFDGEVCIEPEDLVTACVNYVCAASDQEGSPQHTLSIQFCR